MFPGGTGTGPGGTSGAPGWIGGVRNTPALPTVRSFPPPRAPFSYPTIGTFYVDSVAGGNQYPYSSWAWAARALGTIAGVDRAGNTVYIDDAHSESPSGATIYTWSGTATAPVRILCADKATGEPPSALSTGAVIDCTSRFTISGNTEVVYFYGITFKSGANIDSSTVDAIGCGAASVFEQCSFELTDTSGQPVRLAFNGDWVDCFVKFAAAAHYMAAAGHWNGGGISVGGTSPTSLVKHWYMSALIENVDLSAGSSSMNLCSHTIDGAAVQRSGITRFRNIKLPSSWIGSLELGTNLGRSVAELNNGDSAGTNYILSRQTAFGSVSSETTIVRTGGASDGTTPLSWELVTNASAGVFPIGALESGEFVIWNDTVGSSKTITVEVVYDSLTNLQNDELWLEVNYYGASGNPQGTLVSSAMVDVLATPADLPVSGATWTTTGMANPNKGQLQVTFTPQLKGFFIATVKLCKASTTVYVDPMMTVS